MPTVLIALQGVQSQNFELEQGEVLYDGLERQGLELPHGCLAGACGACKVVVLEGAAHLDEPGVVEKNSLEAIYRDFPHAKGKAIRLSCRARVLGKVKITPFDE